MVVAYQTEEQEDGIRAVAFLDGHVVGRVSAEEWEQMKAVSHIP
jgi:hypothetical protein